MWKAISDRDVLKGTKTRSRPVQQLLGKGRHQGHCCWLIGLLHRFDGDSLSTGVLAPSLRWCYSCHQLKLLQVHACSAQIGQHCFLPPGCFSSFNFDFGWHPLDLLTSCRSCSFLKPLCYCCQTLMGARLRLETLVNKRITIIAEYNSTLSATSKSISE